MNSSFVYAKRRRGGVLGIIVLLISLAVVGYLVYLQLQGQMAPAGLDPENLSTKPQQIIDNFKSEAQKIEETQKKALENMKTD